MIIYSLVLLRVVVLRNSRVRTSVPLQHETQSARMEHEMKKEPKYCELCGELLLKAEVLEEVRYDMVTGRKITTKHILYWCPSYEPIRSALLKDVLEHTSMTDVQTYRGKKLISSLQAVMSDDFARSIR